MPTTTTWNIDYPDGSSAITPLESHFGALATSADEALTSLKANVRGSAAAEVNLGTIQTDVTTIKAKTRLNLDRGAGAPSGPPANSGPEGSMYWDETNDILYIYENASGWAKLWEKHVISLTTGVVTAASGWTVTSTYTEKNGIVNLMVQATRTGGTIAAGNITNTTVFTIASGYRPIASQVTGGSGSSGPLSSTYISGGTGVLAAIATDLADNAAVTLAYTYIKE